MSAPTSLSTMIAEEIGLEREDGNGGSVPRASVAASTIGGLLAARARTTPDALATRVYGGASVTFGAWEQRSNRAAAGLVSAGVQPGDRVALLLGIDAWTDFAVAYVGILKTGATVVTIGACWTAIDRRRLLDDAGPAVIVAAAPSAGLTAATVTLADLEAHSDAVRFSPWPAPTAAELRYSSGVLRPPTRRSWSEEELLALAGVAGYGDRPGPWDDVWPSQPDVLLHAFPPGTTAAAAALLAPLGSRRGTTVAARSRPPLGCVDPSSFTDAVTALRPAAVGLPSAAARALLANGALHSSALPAVRSLLIAVHTGSDMTDSLAALFPGVRVSPIRDERAGDDIRLAGSPADGVVPPADPLDSSAAPELVPVLTSQIGMVWHEQLAPGSFNLSPLVRRYTGDLDIDAMKAALSQIVHRHAALRTTFRVVDSELVQAVAAAAPIKVPVVDLSSVGADMIDAELSRRVSDARTRPMDLATGPLFEPMLLKLGPRDHVMLIRVHHTVFDDWSVGQFRAELSSLYGAFRAGDPSPLPPLEASYSDVCHRRFRALQWDVGHADRAFWRLELAGAPATLELDIADPSDPRGTPIPAAPPVRQELAPELVRELRAFARERRTTVFTVVLAAVAVAVGHAAAAEDLVMSMLVADRDKPDEEPLIGCFAKKVVLRLSLSGDPSFTTVVERARQSMLRSMSHKTPAFEGVVQECLDPIAALHGLSARVSVKFQAAAAVTTPLRLPGLEVSAVAGAAPVPAPHFQARRDGNTTRSDTVPWGAGLYTGTFLELTLHDSDGTIALVATGVFHAPAVRRLLSEIIEVVHRAVREPDLAVSRMRGGPAVVVSSGQLDGGAGTRIDVDGFAVEPARIEATLSECAGVGHVAVRARDDESGRHSLVASIDATQADAPDIDALRVQLWRSLPGYAWPASADVVAPSGGDARDTQRSMTPREGSDRTGEHDNGENLVDDVTAGAVRATLLALWKDASGSRRVPGNGNYWQVFSFLDALAEGRLLGISAPARSVMRNRTVNSLAVDIVASEVADPK